MMRDFLLLSGVLCGAMSGAAMGGAVPQARSFDVLPLTSPSPAPAGRLEELEHLPYEPDVIAQAMRRLKAFKRVEDGWPPRDPSMLLQEPQDLARLLAYMAVISHSQGHIHWAILYYCNAIKYDPRYLSLDAVPPDDDKSFLPALQVIRLEALQFFTDRVTEPMPAAEPSKPAGRQE